MDKQIIQGAVAKISAEAHSLLALFAGVSTKLGFGLGFYFVVRSESLGLGLAGLIVLAVLALTDVAEHVHQKRQRRLFGELPLHLATDIPRLGAELAGAFTIIREPHEIDSAWVTLSCCCVHPATGDFDRTEKELWTQRVRATIVASTSGCQAAFSFTVPRSQPRSTYTPGMRIRDKTVEFDEWRVSLEVRTKDGKFATQSTPVTVFAGE